MSQIRKIRRIVTGGRTVDGAGVKLVRVLGRSDVEEFDPFLMLDAFDSDDPADYVAGFPWHPHRGIETVTYLIEGDIAHGDSLGNQGHILAGGCQWMTAGSGIVHQEMPQPAPRMRGLQLWLNLPKKNKWVAPQYRDLTADRIPKVEQGAVTVGVISGSYGSVSGATQGDYVATRILDVTLAAGASWSLEEEPEATLFVYVVAGAGFFAGDSQTLVESHRAVLFGSGDQFVTWAGSSGLRLILFSGRPLGEPIAWGGPIVMNTREELAQAFAELDAGTFLRDQPAAP